MGTKRIDTNDKAFSNRKRLKKRIKPKKELSEEDIIEIRTKKRNFLYHYNSKGMTISKALKKAGVKSQNTIYTWAEDDPMFKEQYYNIRKQKDPAAFYKPTMVTEEKEIDKKVIITNNEDERVLKDALKEAYRYSSFNLTEACNEVGISRGKVVKWMEIDESFKDEMLSVDEEKKDLVESSLLAKVASGDTAAIIFAARCLLPDTYNENKNMIRGRIDVVHSKEETDAIIEAAQITPSKLMNTPGGKLLAEKLGGGDDILEGELVGRKGDDGN